MPYVWMDEVPRVQTVGSGGIGVSPAIPVTEIDKVSGNVRGVAKTAPVNTIPNPGAVNTGDAIVEDLGVWGSGEAGGGLPDPSTANEGDVLTVSSGAWTAAAPSGGGSSVLLVGYSGEIAGALDKTWKEIHDAAPLVWIEDTGTYLPLIYCDGDSDSGSYICSFMYIDPSDNNAVGIDSYVTDSENGYPVYNQE